MFRIKSRKNRIIVRSVIVGVMTVFVVGLFVGRYFAYLYKPALNEFLGLETTRVIGGTDEAIFKSDYAYTNEGEVTGANSLWNDSVAAAKDAIEEGTVILWNHGNALPLDQKAAVSLFSRSSVDPLYSGIGSGGANTTHAVDLVKSLKDVGCKVNDGLVNFYKAQAARETVSPFKRNEAAWSAVSTQSFSGYGDAAIFTLSTMGREEGDLVLSGCDTVSGDQLDLSQAEISTIEGLIAAKKAGTFKKVILLLNTCSSVNFNSLESYMTDIDACVWVGQPGGIGFSATAEVLVGKRNPSGHLPQTYLYDCAFSPSVAAYGDNTFSNASGLNENQSKYLLYNDGIYVGYRYYETRYEDLILNRGNAASTAGSSTGGAWNYESEVAFPFGHGLSYTTFEYSELTVKEEDTTFEVTVNVTNTGDRAGKDAVQVYLQKPYNSIEKASVELVGFEKTEEIVQKDTKFVTVSIDKSQLKTYDDDNEKTFIREAGTYYLTVGHDSHDAMNNILAEKGKGVADGMDADGESGLVFSFDCEEDTECFSKSKNGEKITNKFDHADWNKAGYSDQKITYLSRSDWQGTYPSNVALAATDPLKRALAFDKPYNEDPAAVTPTYGAAKKYTLAEMTGLEYNDPKWDEFMNQITLAETSELIARGQYSTAYVASLNKTDTKEMDGPLGIGAKWKVSKHVGMSFATPPTIAATFNPELIERIGVLKGENMLHSGYNGIYGTACGINRNPYGGRSYEYYSEDPYLSAVGVTQETIGIQSRGGYVMIKHMVLNDQEINRKGVATFTNEQAMREIYLEPFRMAVEVGNAHGIMSAFNRVGAIWCGADRNLLTDVLRDEWGFEGMVISDCPVLPYMSFIDGILAGNDIWLYSNPANSFVKFGSSPTASVAMRKAAKRICYTVANSSAMNGVTAETEYEPIINWWEYVITVLNVLTCVMLAAAIAWLLPAIFKKDKAAIE